MKSVVFFGSARENGRTRELLNFFLEQLEGEVDFVDCYRINVSPCRDCRYCMRKKGCSINDDMTALYDKIDECDNIVFAAPMYFHSVPAPMKTVTDRLQPYWASSIRKDRHTIKPKKGGMILVGGAKAFKDQFTAGTIMLKGVLDELGAECTDIITMANADEQTLKERPDIKEALIKMAEKLRVYS